MDAESQVEILLSAAWSWKGTTYAYHAIRSARKGHGWAANVAALPLPPGVNNLFPTRGRVRVKSRQYREWEEEAAYWWLASPLSKQPAWPLDEKPRVLWTLDTYIFIPTWQADLDNKLKAPIDFLCKHTGLRDRYLVEIHAKRITIKGTVPGMVLAIGVAK